MRALLAILKLRFQFLTSIFSSFAPRVLCAVGWTLELSQIHIFQHF